MYYFNYLKWQMLDLYFPKTFITETLPNFISFSKLGLLTTLELRLIGLSKI